MGKILVLATTELVNGFRLAGLGAEAVRSEDETYQKLTEAVRKRSHEIIVLPQEYLLRLDERKRREIDELTDEVVVPVPMFNLENQPSPRAFVSEMVRRAVGFSIKV